LNSWKLWILPIVIIFYSNFPDLDHHLGRLRRNTLKFIFWSMICLSLLSLFVHIGVSLILFALTGYLGVNLLKTYHRGVMHQYWFCFIASMPMLLIHWFLFIIAITCSFLHIFVDRFWSNTKRKVRKATGTQNKTYNLHFRW